MSADETYDRVMTCNQKENQSPGGSSDVVECSKLLEYNFLLRIYIWTYYLNYMAQT